MGYLEKGPTSHEHPDSAGHMPGTELRSSAHRHRSAGAHLTHLLDHESPPGPRRPPESSPSSPGRSSSASDHRASRLSAAMAWVRAVGRRFLASGLLLACGGLFAAAAQAQTVQTLVSNASESRSDRGRFEQPFACTGLHHGRSNADGYTLFSVRSTGFGFGVRTLVNRGADR